MSEAFRQRLDIARSAKRCRRCILGLMFSASSSSRIDAVYTSKAAWGRGCVTNFGTLASGRQNISLPKYNDDYSLPILLYLISADRPWT
jgi:hypothetical protein